MTHFKKLINITTLALISVFIISCSTTTDQYYNLIPSNSFIVANINGDQLDKAAGLTDEQKAIITKNMDEFADGLKFYDSSEPICFFMTNDLEIGVVAKIKNTDEFKSQFDIWKNELDLVVDTETDEYTLAHSNNEEVAVAYRGNSLILMGKSDDFADVVISGKIDNTTKIVDRVRAIIKGETESIASTKSFKKFISEKSDIGYLFIADNNFPIFKYPEDFIMGAYLNFEAGKIAYDVDFITEPTDLVKLWKDYIAKPDGKFDKYIPSDYIMYATGAVSDDDPKEVFDMAKEVMDQYFAAIESTVSRSQRRDMEMAKSVINEAFENIMSSFNGEIVFSINNLTMMPEAVFMADVKNKNILDKILENIPTKMVTKKADDQYVVNAGMGVEIEVGMKDNVLYMTNSAATFNAFNEDEELEDNFTSTPFAKDIKGTYGGLDIRVDRLMESQMMKMMGRSVQQLPLISQIENLEMVSEDIMCLKTSINMKDKKNNALNTIMVDLLKLYE